jgi:hypothetical protein
LERLRESGAVSVSGRAGRGSGRVDVQGVQAGRKLALEGVVDRPVTAQPGQAGQGGGPDLHRIVCLAPGRCARMPMVKVGLVNYMQLCRRKSSFQRGFHALCPACQFLRH